jgi:hypothetical protein
MERLQRFELYCLPRWVLSIFGSIYAPIRRISGKVRCFAFDDQHEEVFVTEFLDIPAYTHGLDIS